MPRLPAEVRANVQKAREAGLLAVETYNRPATVFRSAGFIVLMVVAWTALFHAAPRSSILQTIHANARSAWTDARSLLPTRSNIFT